MAPALGAAIAAADPTAVFLPMGLANPDHVLTHDAGLMVRSEHAPVGDSVRPGSVTRTTATSTSPASWPGGWRNCSKPGLWPTPAVVAIEPDMDRKRTAISFYKSQVAPLERDHVLTDVWPPTCPSSTGVSPLHRPDGSASSTRLIAVWRRAKPTETLAILTTPGSGPFCPAGGAVGVLARLPQGESRGPLTSETGAAPGPCRMSLMNELQTSGPGQCPNDGFEIIEATAIMGRR